MLYLNTPSSSISNLVLYPRSAFGGEIIFVIGSIRFNWESMDSIFLQLAAVRRPQGCHRGCNTRHGTDYNGEIKGETEVGGGENTCGGIG